MRLLLVPLALLLAVQTSAPQAPADATAAERRGRAFWSALVGDCRVPAGESASGLVGEALDLLGSPSSEWRDDVGYGVVASCVYRQRRLSAEERRELVSRLVGNLRRGIGESGTGSVLLRSFSALDLSVFAALELREPVLDATGYHRLLDAALAYLRDERDLRGFEPEVGWIHATAHTADLLKFLARDARFAHADRERVLNAVRAKMTTPGTPVFTHGEDERLAAALAAVLGRPDCDPALLDPWLEGFVALERSVWASSPPDPKLLDAAQNGRNLLRSLYVILSLPGTSDAAEAAPARLAAREKVLAALDRIRR